MILGIGIDVVHVSRLSRWMGQPDLLKRFFHPDELEAIKNKGSSAVLSLAARFAAKEAFGKALGTGIFCITLKNIQVTNNHNGKPFMTLYGDALEAFKKTGASQIHLSLTHESDNAIAMVVIEG